MNVEELQPLEDLNRVALIENRIKDYIITNQLRPGDKLPTEEQLATALHVGRTAVRETFRRLEALGIVESRQGFGRVVREFNFDPILNELSYGLAFHSHDILQVMGIRKALDAYFIEDAIHNMQEAELRQLAAIVQRMSDGGLNNPHFRQADYEFHALLYRCCGNPLAAQLFEITWKVRMNALDRHAAMMEIAPGTVAEHQAILTAIQQKDVAIARELLVKHHWNMEQRFRNQIEQQIERQTALG